mgnify:CR=1 FL=1
MTLSILLNSGVDNPSDILTFFGRIHPLVVHFPIGFLLLAAIVEISTKWEKFQPLKKYTQYLWALGGISAFFAILFGYFLSLSGDYNADTVFWHKWSGIALLIFSIGCYYISKKQITIPFKGNGILLALIIITVFYTGHLGGNLTHGSTYLLEYAPNPIRQLAGMPKKAIPRKKVTVLVNLAPRALRGVDSEGMILMTETPDGKLVFVNPSDSDAISNGLQIS